MAKEEFSVNELEPVRSTGVVETKEEIKEASVIEEQPVVKKVKVDSDYEGPTAKEIIVNSVKVDRSTKKNFAGLFVLILVLSLIGVVVFYQMSSEKEESKTSSTNYLKDVPKWSLAYNEYLKKNFEELKTYEVAFVDFDFDKNAEAIVKYKNINDKVIYEIVDLFEEDDVNYKYENVSDVLMMYSFENNEVKWYFNVSLDNDNFHLVDIAQRIDWDTNYEIYFDSDSLTQFKSDHMNLSYDIKFTELHYRDHDKLFAEAANNYETENEIINKLIDNSKENYKDVE